jgi:signal transduction histidine kinase
LETALAEIAKQMKNGINNTEIITHTTGSVRTLPPSVENHLFRIGQEAVNNALKHAHAKTIQINLCYTEKLVRLSVCDDGVGFDQSAVLAGTVGQHLGLRSLRDRARKMGGQLTVVSESGKGATIEVVVPLNNQNSEAS